MQMATIQKTQTSTMSYMVIDAHLAAREPHGRTFRTFQVEDNLLLIALDKLDPFLSELESLFDFQYLRFDAQYQGNQQGSWLIKYFPENDMIYKQ